MKKFDKVDDGSDYKPSKTRTVAICDKNTGWKTIYVTPAFAGLYEREKQKDWSSYRREHRCIIRSERYGFKRCQGKCEECEYYRTGTPASLSSFVDENGDEFEPNQGEWKEIHESEDPRVKFNKDERSRAIESRIVELIGEIGYSILKSVYGEGYTILDMSKKHNINYSTLKERIQKWVGIIKKNKANFF